MFLQRVRRRDPQLGFTGFSAIEQLLIMRNAMLEMEAVKQPVALPVSQVKTKSVKSKGLPRGRRCTDDPVPTRRSDRVWRLPASATVSRNPVPETEDATMHFQALLAMPEDVSKRTDATKSTSAMNTVAEASSEVSKVTAGNMFDPILPSVGVEQARPSIPLVGEDVWSVVTDGIFAFMEEDYFIVGKEDL